MIYFIVQNFGTMKRCERNASIFNNKRKLHCRFAALAQRSENCRLSHFRLPANLNLINGRNTAQPQKRDTRRHLGRPVRGKRKQQVRRIPPPILISGIRETCSTPAAAAFIFRARCNKCYFCSRRANLAHCDGHISRKLREGPYAPPCCRIARRHR